MFFLVAERILLATPMAVRPRMPAAFAFTFAHRLHYGSEFDVVYRQGRRLGDAFFSVVCKTNERGHPRLGLSIGAKIVGIAANRNRVKRIIRESFRKNAQRLPSLDIVVNARPAARTAKNEALNHSLEQLWDKLARHA